MIPYIILLVAFFLLSSSQPDTIRLNNHQVNIVTATPNTNTRRNAMRLPMIPSNQAVFQNSEPPYVFDQFGSLQIEAQPGSGENTVYTRLGILRNKNQISA